MDQALTVYRQQFSRRNTQKDGNRLLQGCSRLNIAVQQGKRATAVGAASESDAAKKLHTGIVQAQLFLNVL